MAISSSCFNLEEAMDKIWFHTNILLFQPSNLNVLSMLKKDENILKPTTSSEDSSFYELLQPVLSKSKNKHVVEKMKNNGVSSSPFKDRGSQQTQLRVSKIGGSHWSSYELENYALKGPTDVNLVFSKEKNGDREKKLDAKRGSYLSEPCFINRADFPLLDLRMLPKTIEVTDMKRYLRFWAQKVASIVSYEL